MQTQTPASGPPAAAGSSALQHRWLVRLGLLLLGVVLIGFTLRCAMDRPAAPPRAAPPVVATLVAVQREDVPQFLTGVGTVQAQATVTVKARIDGQLESVGFTEGQDVKAGQVLAQIDARALRAQLEQAQAQKARDEAQLANARLDLERYTRLANDQAVPRQTLDTQRALVAQMQAALLTDEAQIHIARVQLGYATITAPLSGRVGARLVDPGNIVHAADAGGLVVINQIDPVTILFTVPDDALQVIQRAQLHQAKARLSVLAYARQGDGLLGQGELVLINNQIDTGSGTVQLKARFANPQHRLWPGQYVNVRLLLGRHEQALTVPAGVVQRGQSGAYAYAVVDGHAQMRPIEVLQTQDGKAVIARGLQAGELVVLDGQYKIKPGVAVSAAAASVPAAAASGTKAAR
jgi:multidrug efflux system membrane fusion protein